MVTGTAATAAPPPAAAAAVVAKPIGEQLQLQRLGWGRNGGVEGLCAPFEEEPERCGVRGRRRRRGCLGDT
jgi:hypothetical protein